jgi:hypothetical protein
MRLDTWFNGYFKFQMKIKRTQTLCPFFIYNSEKSFYSFSYLEGTSIFRLHLSVTLNFYEKRQPISCLSIQLLQTCKPDSVTHLSTGGYHLSGCYITATILLPTLPDFR